MRVFVIRFDWVSKIKRYLNEDSRLEIKKKRNETSYDWKEWQPTSVSHRVLLVCNWNFLAENLNRTTHGQLTGVLKLDSPFEPFEKEEFSTLMNFLLHQF